MAKTSQNPETSNTVGPSNIQFSHQMLLTREKNNTGIIARFSVSYKGILWALF